MAATGWFNRQYLEHLISAHDAGTRDYSASIWTLLMFEAFLRRVVDGDDAPMVQGNAAPARSAVSA